jgi:hypothetical protein
MTRRDALELDPVEVARTSLVGCIRLFGHDSLKPLSDRLLEDALQRRWLAHLLRRRDGSRGD